MDLIVLTETRGTVAQYRLRPKALTFGVVACLLALSGLVYFAFSYGVDRGVARAQPSPEAAYAQWQNELATQRQLIEEARRDAEGGLNALALRLGRLQAELLRVDALGERLVEVAQLPAGEFDFRTVPALGGPESPVATKAGVHDFVVSLDALAQRLEDRSDKLEALELLLLERALKQTLRPEGRPVREGYISSGYGRRTDPINGRREFHGGLDFVARPGTDILAVADGVVTFAGTRPQYGRTVEITHGGGFVTRYAHNKENRVVVGERVARGEVIAALGSSGRTTGPHLHFEVLKDGQTVEPLSFIGPATGKPVIQSADAR